MAASPAKPPAEKLDPTVVKTALILIAGGLAVIFDTTIVSVALHTLALKLDTSVATIQWVTTGYLLALGIAVPLSTWGLQRFGGKRLWMFSLAVFLAGSVGSSLAWNVGSLIGARVVQGIGGGLMLPLMATLIFQAAGGKSLGRLVTYVALPALLGPPRKPVTSHPCHKPGRGPNPPASTSNRRRPSPQRAAIRARSPAANSTATQAGIGGLDLPRTGAIRRPGAPRPLPCPDGRRPRRSSRSRTSSVP
jgi:Major Facilitator Superfamily